MLPRLPVLGLPTYGLLVASGFLAALVVVEWLARRQGFPRNAVQDVVVRGSLWGLLGAKLLLVVVEPRESWRTLTTEPLAFLGQGGVFYGGLVLATVMGLLRARRVGLDPHATADVVAPGIALGHAFGRLGCFMAGCCWGRTCDLPWAVHYTHPDAIAAAVLPPSVGVHPVQLYEAGANLVLFGLCLLVLARRPFPGAVFWSYLVVYGALRIALEELRADPRGGLFGGAVSTSQAVGAAAALAGAVMLAWRWRAARSAATARRADGPTRPDAPGSPREELEPASPRPAPAQDP